MSWDDALSFAPRAQRDVDEIIRYTLHHWGKAQVAEYKEAMKSALRAIVEYPSMGKLHQGYHSYPAGKHVIFYRISGAEILIIRILHERMDSGRHLGA